MFSLEERNKKIRKILNFNKAKLPSFQTMKKLFKFNILSTEKAFETHQFTQFRSSSQFHSAALFTLFLIFSIAENAIADDPDWSSSMPSLIG